MAKIKSITVSNLKPIAKLTANFNGATAIITAGNNKGKTSFLRSHIDRLQQQKVATILKQDEKEGFSEIELTTGEKFIWTFNEKGKEKLTFISERNIPGPVTKELGRVYFPPVFDIDQFLHSQPAEQKKVLQKLTGLDFTEVDKALAEAQEARKFANRMKEIEQAKLGYIDPKLPAEPESTELLEAELNGIAVHNLRNKQVKEAVTQKQREVGDIEVEINALRAKIADLEYKALTLNSEISKGGTWLLDVKNQPKTNEEELRAQITAIKEANKAIEENKKAKLQQEAFDKAVVTAAEADADVKKIENDKLEMIRLAALPEGFGFSATGVTYDGFEFNKEALSSSKVYIGALKLAALELGEVKTLYFDASYLDNNSLAQIETWAAGQGLQLLIEMPDRAGGPIEYQIIQS